MASSKKCDSCNVVISEVLAFIQNKLEVMDEVSMTRICTSSFTTEEIVTAKNLLFECVKSTKKKIQRKKEGKAQRDLEDIMALFKELDPDEFPVFVAKNLNLLPPITFDHVDCTRILKDLLVMQKDIASIKETYVTMEEINVIKNELTNLKTASIVNNFDMMNVNTVRGSSKYVAETCDSGPFGILHIPEQPLLVPESAQNLPFVEPSKEANNHSKKTLHRSEIPSVHKSSDLPVTGSVLPGNDVDQSTSAQDISSYIMSKTQVDVILEKIKAKTPRNYDAYKVLVPKSKISIFMDVELWPDGITFRRFVNFRRDGLRGATSYGNI